MPPREGMPSFTIYPLIISRFLPQVRNFHDLDCKTSAFLPVVLIYIARKSQSSLSGAEHKNFRFALADKIHSCRLKKKE